MPCEMSAPTTSPVCKTDAASTSVAFPPPLPMSSARSPGWALASLRRRGITLSVNVSRLGQAARRGRSVPPQRPPKSQYRPAHDLRPHASRHRSRLAKHRGTTGGNVWRRAAHGPQHDSARLLHDRQFCAGNSVPNTRFQAAKAADARPPVSAERASSAALAARVASRAATARSASVR